ncbi:hypothetical protein PspLS_03895 [Pyricularia sp. CBS 133598]|nr:hypothetical protein PspLS_03895 [Pyricularia sp. CBS 133598]
MEERGKILVSIPVKKPTRSYWQDPPDLEIASLHSSPDLPHNAAIVIIGSGITGAAVAWHLLQDATEAPKPKVVMLEAREICSGATGRNGGHTKAASYRSFAHNASTLGTKAAVQIARLELANVKAVHAFAAAHDIVCDSRPRDTLDVFYDQDEWNVAKAAVAAMQAAMPGDEAAEFVLVDTGEAREQYFCGDLDGRLCGALRYPAGSINAYRFTTGVLKLCLASGLEIHANTPATSVAKADDGSWQITTPRGNVTAKEVVLATNGYTAALDPRFQVVVVPLRGQVTAQRPGLNMPPQGLPQTYSFIYRDGFEYMVSRRAEDGGDIIIGGGLYENGDKGVGEAGNTDDAAMNEVISSYLRDMTPRYFGTNWGENHPGGQVRKEWTGIMGYSADGYPVVGRMPNAHSKDLWACCSFQGHGMVLCWMSAKALVEMIRRRDNEDLKSWFPNAFRITKERLQRRFQGLI